MSTTIRAVLLTPRHYPSRRLDTQSFVDHGLPIVFASFAHEVVAPRRARYVRARRQLEQQGADDANWSDREAPGPHSPHGGPVTGSQICNTSVSLMLASGLPRMS